MGGSWLAGKGPSSYMSTSELVISTRRLRVVDLDEALDWWARDGEEGKAGGTVGWAVIADVLRRWCVVVVVEVVVGWEGGGGE